jgi:hypothetical protein
VADENIVRVDFGPVGDVAAVAGAIDFHGFVSRSRFPNNSESKAMQRRAHWRRMVFSLAYCQRPRCPFLAKRCHQAIGQHKLARSLVADF